MPVAGTGRRLAASVCAVALLVGGCTAGGGGAGPDSELLGDGLGFVEGDGSALVVPVDERVPAPDVTAPLLEPGSDGLGQEASLASLMGEQATVVNFWASWCGPCREEAPALLRVAQETADEGVAFVGVNFRDSADAADAFVSGVEERTDLVGASYPSLVDTDARLTAAFAGDFRNVPTTLVLDAEGRVAAKGYGALTATQLTALLDAVRGA